jgi:hypothetical protein
MPHENACQGLPNGPCPKQRQDSSVVFTIYDLFLCPNCIIAREQAAGGTNANAAAAAVTAMTNEAPAKTTKNKTRKADSAATTRNTRQQTKQNVTNINDEAATSQRRLSETMKWHYCDKLLNFSNTKLNS